jgi:hypothetical protein
MKSYYTLCEGELFAVAISNHPIITLSRSPAARLVHVRIVRSESTMLQAGAIYRRNLARTFRQDYTSERLEMRRGGEGQKSDGRQTNGEIGTYARLAANLDISSMGADNGFDYAQAEAETGL